MPLHRRQRSDSARRFVLVATGLPLPFNLPAKMVAPRGSALEIASPCSRVKPTRATDSATFAATAGETVTVRPRMALLRVISIPCHASVPQTAILRVPKAEGANVSANCPGFAEVQGRRRSARPGGVTLAPASVQSMRGCVTRRGSATSKESSRPHVQPRQGSLLDCRKELLPNL